MQSYKDFSILLGEDEEPDVRVIKYILSNMNYDGDFQRFAFGQDIIDWSLKQGVYQQAAHSKPNLLFLDIGLPGVDGKSVLKTLRNDDFGKTIPVIMMSGSVSLRDYNECIALGCNAYIQKTDDIENFGKACQLFIDGWKLISEQNFF